MQPSIAFVITRMPWYRHFAAPIDSALARGWTVECWHNTGSKCSRRPLDFPSIQAAPKFKSGKVHYREFDGQKGFYELMQENSVDAVVDVNPILGAEQYQDVLSGERPLYICLDGNWDWPFYAEHEHELTSVDHYAMRRPFWVDLGLRGMKEVPRVFYSKTVDKEIRRKTSIVGWPQMDQLSMIRSRDVRKKWGIPEGQPVVLYLNWPDFRCGSLPLKIFNVLSLKTRLGLMAASWREWRQFPKQLFAPTVADIVNSLRSFCDKNNAFLLVKCRNRDQVLPVEEAAADKVIYDESFYPNTIFEVMKISSLCIGYLSFAVREAAVSGVPFLGLDVAGLSEFKNYGETGESFYRGFLKSGGFFNSPGVAWPMQTDEMINKFKNMSLDDFQVEPDAQDTYFRKYIGIPDQDNTEVFLNTVKDLVDRKRSATEK